MTRYHFIVEYDGSGYVGWQRQTNGSSVQAALEMAIHEFCGETVSTVAAGRTDAGVHARGQSVHCDIEAEFTPDTIQKAINFHLQEKSESISVLSVREVDKMFHARFSAVERHYHYRIINRGAPLTLDAGRAFRIVRPLDEEAMQAGATHLVGNHDFTTFRSVNCQAKSPVKTLDLLDVSRHGEEILFDVRARSFLHHQVRSMVGSLRKVGEGAWSPDDIRKALDARDRTACGPVAPSRGLCLMDVTY